MDPVTFIKFRYRLVVSRATLNIVEKVTKVIVFEAGAATEEQKKLFVMFMCSYYCVITKKIARLGYVKPICNYL